jgi:hypothetical protein
VLLVYFKLLELKGIGGTDYSANFSQLRADAASLSVGTDPEDVGAARVSIQAAAVTASGATLPADVNAALLAAAALIPHDDMFLNQIDLMLTCKLGVHKAYTQ